MKIAMIALTCANVYAVDGDSLFCDRERVRLFGFDTPEIHGPCPHKAVRAYVRLSEALDGKGWQLVPKRLRDGRIERSKHGNVVAWLLLADGRDAAQIMIAEGHARAYDGKSKRRGWC